jgi:V/A-type H+-transporting ATPase subunit E
MDIQLQELIGKIKKDGIESAVSEAEKVKATAKADAARIVEDAKKEAARIVEHAEQDAGRFEKAGIAAVEQASRNTLLAFKDQIQGLLDRIVQSEVSSAYSADALKQVIPDVLKAWGAGKEGGIDVILSEKNLKDVEGYLNGKLTDAIKGGVEFRLARNMESGFRIAEKSGAAYYDFSAEQVASAFSAYLNPRLAETTRLAAKGI